MKVFLSYPGEEREMAQRVEYALLAQGHDVFFDLSDLAAGLEYDQAIARAIEDTDLLVFLVTPAAVERGSYTLTELGLAERRWPHPSGRVLPIMLRPTALDTVPAYLRAVSILEPRGDVVAETAHEVQRMARAIRFSGRALVRLRSRAGVVSLLLFMTLVGAMLWRPWTDSASSQYTPLPENVRHRARAVAAVPGGWVVAGTSPSELVRFGDDGARIGEPLRLAGEPVGLARVGGQLLVTTRGPDGIAIYHVSAWDNAWTIPLDAAGVDRAEGTTVSGDIQSVAIAEGKLWVVTGERDGDPAVLRLRPNRQWVVATDAITVPPEFDFDARGLRLRTIGRELWAVTGETTPSSLYRIWGTIRVDEVRGHDVPMVSCAHDLAEGAGGTMLLLSCDNELLEVVTDSRPPRLIRSRSTLPSESAPENWTDEIIVRDGASVFIAFNTQLRPSLRPAHARIARVDDGGVATLLDERDAIVTSMAVASRAILAVLRRADGTTDAISVTRNQ